MQITVQKYGGSSVADPERIRHVADRVAERHRSGDAVVVVVSAMGRTTDELLDLARDVSSAPDRRELDVLLSSGERVSTSLVALALQELGVDAVSLTGAQSGVRTTGQHFNAEILDVSPDRVRDELLAGRVVVAAGFQGVSPEGETTTLGRGGSDTSAVAIAAALDARRCEIFSDVEGVYTADPRLVDRAEPLDAIGYPEMIELARHGAGVLHLPALEHARDHALPLRAASTFSDAPGTLIGAEPESGEGGPDVKGIACHRELFRLTLSPSASLEREVLEAAGDPEVFLHGIPSDAEDHHDLLLRTETVADGDALAATLEREFGRYVRFEAGLGSVSAVGRDLGRSEAPRRAIEQLRERLGSPAGRHLHAEHSRTLLLESERVPDALRALHGALVEPDLAASGAGA